MGVSADGTVSIKVRSVPHDTPEAIEAGCPQGEVVVFSQLDDASATSGAGALASPVVTLDFGDSITEEFQLVVRSPGDSITVRNVGSTTPTNSDTMAVFSDTLVVGLESGDVPTQSVSSSSSANPAGAIAGAFVGCLVIGVALFGLKKQGYIGRGAQTTEGSRDTQMPSVPTRASKDAKSGWIAGNETKGRGTDVVSIKKKKNDWMNNAESVV
jgi:hypothetical protein